MHTPSSAARAAGVAKSTIYTAIRAGRLSAQKLNSGRYAIYPAELRRAFPLSPLFARAEQALKHIGFPMWDVG